MRTATGIRGAFWPTRTQEALISVAFSDPGDTASRWIRVRPQLDFDHLETGTFALLPAIYAALARDDVADPELSRLKGIYRSTFYKNSLMLHGLGRIVAALESEEIRFALLAGLGAALRFHGGLALRPTAAIELLLDREDARVAARILESVGWSESSPEPSNPSQVVILTESGGLTCVLRFSVGPISAKQLLREDRLSVGGESFLELQQIESHGVSLPVLPAALELIAACVLGARAKSVMTIQWIVDVLAIIRSESKTDWNCVIERTEEHHQELRLLNVLTYLGRFTVPDDVERTRERLSEMPVPYRQRMAYVLSSGAIRGSGGLPQTIGEHLERTIDKPLLTVLETMPSFLSQRWGLAHEWQLPGHALRRAHDILTARHGRA